MKRGLCLLLAAVLAALAGGCFWGEDAFAPAAVPVEDASRGDVVPVPAPAAQKPPFRPPEGCIPLTRGGGRDRVARVLDDGAYSGIERYPGLLPYCRYELAVAAESGADLDIAVAEHDMNGDGEPDYFLRFQSPMYGGSGSWIVLVPGPLPEPDHGEEEAGDEDESATQVSPENFEEPEGQITVGWCRGEVGILDSETNDFLDLAFSEYRYIPVLQFSGRTSYLTEDPVPLHIRSPLGGADGAWVGDGVLYLSYSGLTVGGDWPVIHRLPVYMGITVDALAHCLEDPVLWACDELNRPQGHYAMYAGSSYTFAARVRDEAALLTLLEEEPAPVPDDVVFAHVPKSGGQDQVPPVAADFATRFLQRDVQAIQADMGEGRVEILALPRDEAAPEPLRRTHHMFSLWEAYEDYSVFVQSFFVSDDLSEFFPAFPLGEERESMADWRHRLDNLYGG